MGSIHSDLKSLFSRSNATTIQTRIAATVLTCTLQTSFLEKPTKYYRGYAITFPHIRQFKHNKPPPCTHEIVLLEIIHVYINRRKD
jgi:hypothetical protein